jgi:type IV pilus assembly protein PilM
MFTPRRRQTGRYHPIGLDIGSAAVKLLQLRTPADGVTEVAAAVRVELPQLSGLSPALAQDATITALRNALRAGPFVGRRVSAALPRNAVHLRTIRVSPSGAAGFDPLVAAEREAAASFSFPLASARVAFLPAGDVRQGGESRHEVIAAAATDGDVAEFLDLLDRAGLDADGLDLEPAALFRAAERAIPIDAAPSGVRVILDVGAAATQVVIGRDGELCVVKNLPLGLRQIEDAVAKRLSVSSRDVRQLRVRFAAEPDPSPAAGESAARRDPVHQALHDAMRVATAGLLEQAVLCVRYYVVSFRGRPPAKAWLTGGGADGADLCALARAALGMPVAPLPLMAGVPLGPLVALENTSPLGEWAVAYGLALRGVANAERAAAPPEVAGA